MSYLTIKEASTLWGISERRLTKLCKESRITGAKKFGWSWAIPSDASKPVDARKKNAKSKLTPTNKTQVQPVIERIWAMPNKNTFSILPIKNLILEEKTAGVWIDPFANSNKLATITNDLNPQYDTDYHLDALDFLKQFDDQSIDGILYDPPYSPRQVSECYNHVGYNVTWDTTKASFWSNHKKEISRILKVGGKVITFGWNSGGIGISYGCQIKRILLVPHGGWHNDTICTVETKVKNIIFEESSKKSTQTKQRLKDLNMNTTDKKILTWANNLPENFWDFKTDDTSALTHGLHTYPATMIYPISRNIIKKMSEFYPIDALLDPFSGSGTVPVEGVLSGIPNIYANDLNPLSILLTEVKTTPIEKDTLLNLKNTLMVSITQLFSIHEEIIKNIDSFISVQEIDITDNKTWGANATQYIEQYFSLFKNISLVNIPNFKNIGYWFKPKVLIELSLIAEAIKRISEPILLKFVLVTFSEVMRLVSNRRNGEFKMYRMPKDKVKAFNPDTLKLFLNTLNTNIDKINEFKQTLGPTKFNIHISSDNSTELNNVPDNSIDLVVTSPPYGDSRTTVAYGEFSRLTLQWINYIFNISDENNESMKLDQKLMGGEKYRNGYAYELSSPLLKKSLEEIFIKDQARSGDVFSFYKDLDLCLKSISKKSKPNTYQFWVVGNRTVKGVYLETDKILTELATNHQLEYITTLTRNIHNKVMPSKNSPTNKKGSTVSTMTKEFIVVLKKSADLL